MRAHAYPTLDEIGVLAFDIAAFAKTPTKRIQKVLTRSQRQGTESPAAVRAPQAATPPRRQEA
jgi:hypothetical protein